MALGQETNRIRFTDPYSPAQRYSERRPVCPFLDARLCCTKLSFGATLPVIIASAAKDVNIGSHPRKRGLLLVYLSADILKCDPHCGVPGRMLGDDVQNQHSGSEAGYLGASSLDYKEARILIEERGSMVSV